MLFTFQRMLDKDHPFRKAYPTEFPYFTDMGLDKNIARVEKLDEQTAAAIQTCSLRTCTRMAYNRRRSPSCATGATPWSAPSLMPVNAT